MQGHVARVFHELRDTQLPGMQTVTGNGICLIITPLSNGNQ
jgi:hypothetical protein